MALFATLVAVIAAQALDSAEAQAQTSYSVPKAKTNLVGLRTNSSVANSSLANSALANSALANDAGDGVLFGAWAQPRGGESGIQAVERLERELGSRLSIIRSFDRWESNLNNGFTNWVLDGDRRLMISVKPQRNDGSIIEWADIATAQPGSSLHTEMVEMARSVARLDGEVWFTFHHEPEAASRLPYGNSSDYVAAWRALHEVFTAEGASVQWVWTMTSFSFDVAESDRRAAANWFPGEAYVDYLGADPYNWNQCRGNSAERWTEFEALVEGFVRFGDQYPALQLVLPEFGSAEGASGQKAAWLRDAASYLKRPAVASRFAAVVYFHDTHEGSPACNWWLDSSTSTIDAARSVATDPFFSRNLETPSGPPAQTAPALGPALFANRR